jgi:hypothetical protein
MRNSDDEPSSGARRRRSAIATATGVSRVQRGAAGPVAVASGDPERAGSPGTLRRRNPTGTTETDRR